MSTLLDRPRRGAGGAGCVTPRVLLSLAVAPTVTGVAVVVALVLVFLVANSVDLGATAGVVSAVWLAAHQVPVTIGGSALGVLPLLPTLALVWFTERTVAASGVTGRSCGWVLLAVVAGPLVATAAAIGMLDAAAGAVPVAGPHPVLALAWVAGVHLLGAVLGLARPSGQLSWLRRVLPGWMWAGAVQAPRVVAALLGVGGLLTVLALVSSAPTVAQLVGSGGSVGGGVGLVVLSVLYLPNVVVGATSFVVGPGAVVGQTTVTAFGAVNGALPPLPVLAVLPDGTGSWWWALVLLVPAGVGALLGRRCVRAAAERADTDRTDTVRTALVAAVLSGTVLGVLGAVSGGALGAFTPVGVPVLGLAAATTAWTAVVGSVTVLILARRSDPPVDAGLADVGPVDAGPVDARDLPAEQNPPRD